MDAKRSIRLVRNWHARSRHPDQGHTPPCIAKGTPPSSPLGNKSSDGTAPEAAHLVDGGVDGSAMRSR
ncbi:hypothetical protein CCM_06944 [Cordyceps militaris CM01]|uniref:Uncharacterized protein n=1 Tax=Cordyceps militaris (strain CM01) TaxID=983644 RepID=G3JLF0_CORMM|nr:uncharacterized protein CCM_06944 [Cordyceps militaris CM01]EGX90524.1 hypothetical protein CCM_06944 [Cordyceps militaris CM01]